MGTCIPNPENLFLCSLASWTLAAQLNALPGADGASVTYTYQASMAKESGSDISEKEAQGVEKATLQSTSFVMTQTVHEDAKECIENTRQVIEDCPDPVGDTVRGIVDAAIPMIGTLVKALPLIGMFADPLAAVADAFWGIFGKKTECDPVTITESISNCVNHGTSSSSSEENKKEQRIAHDFITEEVKKLSESVVSGEKTSCTVVAPPGVTIWQLYLHTPAAEKLGSVNSRLCIFCMTWGSRPQDPPNSGICGSTGSATNAIGVSGADTMYRLPHLLWLVGFAIP